MTTISAVILARNEEENIRKCIETVKFCDEIIVIDDNSTDKTATIAKSQKAKVVTHPLENDFSKQRNFAMQQATGEWIFFIDADERVTPFLAKEIQRVSLLQNDITGYYIKRDDYMWGKLLRFGETGNLYLLRLARRNSGKWIGKVHENWVAKGKTATLTNILIHYPHVTVSEFLSEINFYSTLRAQELFSQKEKTSWYLILAFPLGKFFQNYIFRLGFLDGTQGLILALFMSMHSFLVRAKLWLLWQKN